MYNEYCPSAPLAQGIERSAPDRKAAGSNPVGCITKNPVIFYHRIFCLYVCIFISRKIFGFCVLTFPKRFGIRFFEKKLVGLGKA